MLELIACFLLCAVPTLATFLPCYSGAPMPDTSRVTGCRKSDSVCTYDAADNVTVDFTKITTVDTPTLTLKITCYLLGIPIDVSPADGNACHRFAGVTCPIAAGTILVGKTNFTIHYLMSGLIFFVEISLSGAAGELMCQRCKISVN